ncbi:hypothetical protein WICPIJ_008712 [Wickerhamomyces pijperi]|uniref:Uncharacterized protein n=1 Tax=Wickerhamomyces pijperi TaxID=599730 RepID=A0A9P8PXH9_WICPI|nr:hypothetical protein WICPIJ_008712 [Wickerhamomyces pijperi]
MADPPLNPSHPNHRIEVPKAINVTLCGLKLINMASCLLPRNAEYTNPPTPEPISTGPPPAKSKTPHLEAQPVGDQTQWQIGQYTSVAQRNKNTICGNNLPLSAVAPAMIAKVTQRNMFWKMANANSG